MGKEFRYERVISSQYDSTMDEDFEETEEFVYEADWRDVQLAVINLVYRDYFKINQIEKEQVNAIQNSIKTFIEKHDLYEQLIDDYEEDIKEYFEKEAFESLED